jgi:hypothetical protein
VLAAHEKVAAVVVVPLDFMQMQMIAVIYPFFAERKAREKPLTRAIE